MSTIAQPQRGLRGYNRHTPGTTEQCQGCLEEDLPESALAGAILARVFTALSDLAARQHDEMQHAIDGAEHYLAGRFRGTDSYGEHAGYDNAALTDYMGGDEAAGRVLSADCAEEGPLANDVRALRAWRARYAALRAMAGVS